MHGVVFMTRERIIPDAVEDKRDIRYSKIPAPVSPSIPLPTAPIKNAGLGVLDMHTSFLYSRVSIIFSLSSSTAQLAPMGNPHIQPSAMAHAPSPPTPKHFVNKTWTHFGISLPILQDMAIEDSTMNGKSEGISLVAHIFSPLLTHSDAAEEFLKKSIIINRHT